MVRNFFQEFPINIDTPLRNTFFLLQNDTMDVLDEKPNGGPSMEIDEVVSVRDRKSFPAVPGQYTQLVSSSLIL
jgi:hypothetical protein